MHPTVIASEFHAMRTSFVFDSWNCNDVDLFASSSHDSSGLNNSVCSHCHPFPPSIFRLGLLHQASSIYFFYFELTLLHISIQNFHGNDQSVSETLAQILVRYIFIHLYTYTRIALCEDCDGSSSKSASHVTYPYSISIANVK